MLQRYSLCGLYVPSCCRWASIAVSMSVGRIGHQSNWLWELGMTTADNMCGGWSLGVGVALAGLLCQLSPPFRYVSCGAGWVVPWCGLKPAHSVLQCVCFGASWERLEWRPQSSMACARLVGGTKWSVVGCCLCCSWRCMGEALLWTKDGRHFWWAWDPLVDTTMWAEVIHHLYQICGHLFEATSLGTTSWELQCKLRQVTACARLRAT